MDDFSSDEAGRSISKNIYAYIPMLNECFLLFIFLFARMCLKRKSEKTKIAFSESFAESQGLFVGIKRLKRKIEKNEFL